MSATKPVVVAVDGSESASSAVVWAARTAVVLGPTAPHRDGGAHPSLLLLRALPRRELQGRTAAHCHRSSGQRTRSSRGKASTTTSRSSPNYSTAASPIALIELSKGAYIIALGPRGHGEFTGLVVGSATVSVVSHGESPVAVVRGRTLDGRPPTEGPVVVGVDGSESKHHEAVEHAFEQASARGATLIAVNVWSDVSVQPSLGATPDDPLWSSIQTGEEVVLAEQLAGFTERYPDVVVERVVARDRPVPSPERIRGDGAVDSRRQSRARRIRRNAPRIDQSGAPAHRGLPGSHRPARQQVKRMHSMSSESHRLRYRST